MLRKKEIEVKMDYLPHFVLLSSFIWIFFHLLRSSCLHKRLSKLPPGPFPIPIIGNILQVRANPLVALENLAKIYGPIMHLKLGNRETIVVSSKELAKEVLMKHDLICSSRPMTYSNEAMNHHEFSLTALPVGTKWRALRRVCKEHIFSIQKMEVTEDLRQEKLQLLRNYLEDCSNHGKVVDIWEVITVTSLNLMSTTLFSMDIASYDSSIEHNNMRKIIDSHKEVVQQPNPADFFPFLKWFDPKGLKKKTEFHYTKLLGMFDEIINKRLQSRDIASDNSTKKDLLQVLLDLNKEDDSELSINDIKHLLLDLILGGASTPTELIHWVMVELLMDPKKMSKAKNELRNVVGEKNQAVESDIPKLSYLNAVIKETLRCHPLTPPLAPHQVEENFELNGYTIPKGTIIVVNIFAIYKDPKIWTNPDLFEPERFLNNNLDYKGQNFEFIPFGSGRRMCPGLPLAHLVAHIMVAHMIHNFDFKLKDMNLDKTNHLMAIPVMHN